MAFKGARQKLVAQTGLSSPGSEGVSFGVFNTGFFSRFGGFGSIVGSATLRYRTGINSGTWLISSSFPVNSGVFNFDVLNHGVLTEFGFSQATSQAINAILIYGEPIR